MRPYLESHVAPSTSLLRFLRDSVEESCFFTSNSYPVACQSPRRGALRQSFHTRFAPPRRQLTTSSACRAEVDPSFEFDLTRLPVQSNVFGTFLRPNHSTLWGSDSHARLASTASRPFLKRLWKQKSRANEPGLQASDLPPLPSFLDDVGGTSLGRSKTGKSGSELKLRCTEIDENGNVTTVNGEFKKSELIAKVCPS